MPATNLRIAEEVIEAEMGTSMFIWGPPGIGKSAIIHQIAKRNDLSLIDIRLSQMDPSDIRGLPYFLADPGNNELKRAHWAIPSFFPNEQIHGPRGILFLDELSSAPPMVQASAYQLVLDRRIGDAVLPDGWHVVAAGNRTSDRSVVYKLAKALANRFVHLEIEPDVDVWKAWAYGKMDPRIIGYISWQGISGLFDFKPDSDEPAFPSPRTWEFANGILNGKLNKAHVELAKNEALHIALAGAVGFGEATKFINYIAITDNLPDIDRIVSDPTANSTISVPDDIALKYATISGIISNLIQRQNRLNASVEISDDEKLTTLHRFFSNSVKYASRFETEYATLFITDLGRVKSLAREVINNQDFKIWRGQNLDMFTPVSK
jgi:hypothetical protein